MSRIGNDNCSEFLIITLLRRGKQVLLVKFCFYNVFPFWIFRIKLFHRYVNMMLLHWNVDTDFTSRTCFPSRNNVMVKIQNNYHARFVNDIIYIVDMGVYPKNLKKSMSGSGIFALFCTNFLRWIPEIAFIYMIKNCFQV
jgi:hypothetical protein